MRPGPLGRLVARPAVNKFLLNFHFSIFLSFVSPPQRGKGCALRRRFPWELMRGMACGLRARPPVCGPLYARLHRWSRGAFSAPAPARSATARGARAPASPRPPSAGLRAWCAPGAFSLRVGRVRSLLYATVPCWPMCWPGGVCWRRPPLPAARYHSIRPASANGARAPAKAPSIARS